MLRNKWILLGIIIIIALLSVVVVGLLLIVRSVFGIITVGPNVLWLTFTMGLIVYIAVGLYWLRNSPFVL